MYLLTSMGTNHLDSSRGKAVNTSNRTMFSRLGTKPGAGSGTSNFPVCDSMTSENYLHTSHDQPLLSQCLVPCLKTYFMKPLHLRQVQHRVASALVVVGDHSGLMDREAKEPSTAFPFVCVYQRGRVPTSSVWPSESST